jgi:hypothetical protein
MSVEHQDAITDDFRRAAHFGNAAQQSIGVQSRATSIQS